LDLSEDEELQQAFDMHSLIVSNVHQEPLFTAEQVIKEIEDMLEVSNMLYVYVQFSWAMKALNFQLATLLMCGINDSAVCEL